MSLILVVTNCLRLAPVSNYDYQVLIGDGTEAGSTIIAAGLIKNHTRTDGWKVLVQMLLDVSK
jgi:hypothetical protein